MSIESRKEKAREQFKANREPQINMLTYDEDILKYMNYHNVSTDDKKKREWVVNSLEKAGMKAEAKALAKATGFELNQIGPMIWARDRDMYLSNKHLTLIDTEVARLTKKYVEKKQEAVADKPAGPTAEERHEMQARRYYGEDIQGIVDEFWVNLALTHTFSMKSYLITNNVSKQVAEIIGGKLAPTVIEVKTAYEGTDEFINESYCKWKKSDLKKLLTFLQGILIDIINHGQVVKAMKRVKEAKPGKSPVLKLRYLESFMELNMRSVPPSQFLGADECYIYRTNRRFIYYKAAKGETIQITGQTISGYDEEASGAKTVKKPEVFFKNLNLSKQTLRQLYESITTSEGPVPPRIQDDMILLKAFT